MLGEGLVGRCAQERETIYMDDIPDSYIKITSGLGTSNPRSLLLVPLKVNEEIHGVLEIASFKAFETYQIDFIEKLGESIAATISSTKINEQTSKLLKESQNQAEKMRAQEEIMRQNMEELQATQEEMKKKELEMRGVFDAIDNTVLKAEFDTEGRLITANDKFLVLLNYSLEEVKGQKDEFFVSRVGLDELQQNWEMLRDGKATNGIVKRKTKSGDEVWVLMSYTPVRDNNNDVMKILFLANDITAQKQIELEAKAQSEELAVQENELRQNMEEMKATQDEMLRKELELMGVLNAIDITSAKVEYNTKGHVISVNEQYSMLLGYTLEEMQMGHVEKPGTSDDNIDIDQLWKQVVSGESYRGIVKAKSKDGKYIWLLITYSPVKNKHGEVTKILCLANDITEQKRMEEELQLSQEVLSQKLEEAKKEMQDQFKEIEEVKIRNEKTLEGMLDAILTIDQEGVIKFFNKAAEELWSIDRKDVLGQNIKSLLPDEDAADENFMENYIIAGVGMRREVNIINKATQEEVPVLMLWSDAQVGEKHTYTSFIQNIEVELF